MDYESKRFVCRFCKGSFDQAENLAKHVQQIHTVRSSNRETRSCRLCGVPSLKPDDYRNHLRYIHGLSQEGQVFSFKSFNDFLMWKNETEKRNYCKFVLRKNPKSLSNKDKLHVYQCDSSRSVNSHNHRSVIASKEKCPAMLTAVESAKNHTVKVEYWNSHVGHAVAAEKDELDAAINSLEVSEVVLEEDQRYNSDSSNSYFVLTDNNEISMSESIVEEATSNKGKKPNSLFFQNKSEASELPKFSFRKDPSKKVPSFQNSLASVACMKPKPKSNVDETISSVISITEEDKSQETNPTDTIFLVSQPQETPAVFLEGSSSQDKVVDGSNKGSEPPRVPESNLLTADPSTKPKGSAPSTSSAAPKKAPPPPTKTSAGGLSLASDSIDSGQYVILNSTPGANGAQNLLLCPVSVASQIQYGSGNKKDNPVIFITPSGKILADKDNSSSVKKIFSGQGKSNAKSIQKENLGVAKSVLKTISVSATFNQPPAILPAPKAPKKTTASQPAVQNVLLGMGPSIGGSPPIIRTPNVQNIKTIAPTQTFMTIPNNLIPLGNSGTFLAPMGSGPVVRPPTPINKTLVSTATTFSTVRTIAPVVNSLPSMPILLVPSTQGQVLTTTTPLIMKPQVSPNAAKTSEVNIVSKFQPTVNSTPVKQPPSFVAAGKILTSNCPSLVLTSPITTTLSSMPGPPMSLPQKSIISTTISNTIQSLRFSAPMPSLGVGRLSTAPSSLIGQMKQGILSKGSICSTPSFTLPSTSKKSGSLLLECPSGGVFTLEPYVNDSIKISSTVSEVSKPVTQITQKVTGNLVKENIKDLITAKTKEPDKCQMPENDLRMETEEILLAEDPVAEENDTNEHHTDLKVGLISKVSSPKKSEAKDSVQIKSIVQEKRPYKEDDVEILKKVKYYQMEMKYLSSQAECKRLKLELAKAKQKNEIYESENELAFTKMEYTIEDQTLDQPLSAFLKTDAGVESIVSSVLSSVVDNVSRNADVVEEPEEFAKDPLQTTSEDIFNNDIAMDVDMEELKPLANPCANERIGSHIPDLNKDIDISELAKQVVEANVSCHELTFNQQSEPESDLITEPLQSLEQQYGQQSQLDIYTMIRTSVLRNLYDDMKGMCEENKKLFDELQRYRSLDQMEHDQM